MGLLVDKVYTRKSKIIAEMTVVIKKKCAHIPEEMYLDVYRSISSRYKKRIERIGNQFELLMVNLSSCEHSEIAPSSFYQAKGKFGMFMNNLL